VSIDLSSNLLAIVGDPSFPSLGQSILYIVGIVFFLLLNAFFVASEFAIVKVRPSQIEAQAKEKGGDPKLALHVVNHLDGYLSANQLGITISSLALGFLGFFFYTQSLNLPLLAVCAGSTGLYLCTVSVSLFPVILAAALGLAGMAGVTCHVLTR
jgi:CBS domain containing-hemolysin-like protein